MAAPVPAAPTPASTWPRLGPALVAPAIGLALVCAVAFAHHRAITRGLDWPAFETQFREMAGAQTMLDEGLGPDASYRDESLWYNPLPAWVIAGTSRLTGLPVRQVVPRSGPYVNLLAPVALFAMVAIIIDPWTALAATAGFVFVMGSPFPDYAAATYSPWLLPNHFTQGLFFLGLIAAWRAARGPGRGRWLVAGALLGAVFLGHTSAALLLGSVLVALAALKAVRLRRPGREAGHLALALGTALVVSLPYTYFIAGTYGLRVVHRDPSVAPWGRLDLNEAVQLLRDLSTLPIALGIIGLTLYARDRRDRSAPVIELWTLAVLAFLAYNYVRLLARKAGLSIGNIVPAFHFLFYLHAALAVGFGVAVERLGSWLAARLRARAAPPMAGGWGRAAAIAGLTAALVAASYPAYLRRDEFVDRLRLAADTLAPFPTDAWHWIRANTRNADVFLSTDEMSLYVVTTAARKVVATHQYFSSPYVDWDRRDRDRNRMFDLIREGNAKGFLRLARPYGVTYVIWSDDVERLVRGGLGMRVPPAVRMKDFEALGLQRVFAGDGVAIFAVPRG